MSKENTCLHRTRNDRHMSVRTKTYIALHLLLMVYSTGAIISKLAAKQEFLCILNKLIYSVL